MAGNRKAAENLVYEFLEDILPGSKNPEIYKEFFASMDDKQFEEWIKSLKNRTTRLAIFAPEGNSGPLLTFERNLKVAKKYGHNFYRKVWMTDAITGVKYLTNNTYLVIKLPLKRQSQFLIKKISIPDSNYTVNDLTGQPTGDSKGSSISGPELQIIAALGLEMTALELIKFRGGDSIAFNALNSSITRSGTASLNAIDALGTKVKAVQSLSTILTSMHLSNTLTTTTKV